MDTRLNQLARVRSLLANKRTYLDYIKMSFAFIMAGIVISALFHTKHEQHNGIAIFLIVVGLMIPVFGYVSSRVIERKIRRARAS